MESFKDYFCGLDFICRFIETEKKKQLLEKIFTGEKAMEKNWWNNSQFWEQEKAWKKYILFPA